MAISERWWRASGTGFFTACLLAGAPGQDWVWQVPALGAVEFRRDDDAKASEPQRTAALAKSAPLAGRPPDKFLQRCAPAPWLCAGELRPDGKALAGPVRDLRDALRTIACDLQSRSSVRTRFLRLVPYGDVVLSGSWSPPGPDGTQTLRGTMAASAPAALAGETREQLARLQPFLCVDASGTLAMARTVDAARGVVTQWNGTLDLVVEEADKSFRRVQVADRWTLVAVHPNQDGEFRTRVRQAIEAGTQWIRDAIDEQKSFLVDKGGDERNYGSGRLALGLLALLHGGVPAADPVVQKGFTELRKRKHEDSYTLATALMALAALHTPPGEASRLREGSLTTLPRRELPAKDRDLAAKWLKQLLGNVDPRGDGLGVLRFNYTAGPRYDTSLQQYGLLGMWAAHGCGLDVPAGAFGRAGKHLLDVQGKARGALTLRTATYAQMRDAVWTDGVPEEDERRAQPRGFAYEEADEPPFGSMTAAGVSGLLLARAGMVARGEDDKALGKAIDDAIRDGYAWLGAEFSVRCNPGWAERADNHWYYWLYCLERSCELGGVARLQGRDWYFEGGLQLMAQQQPNGSFRAEHSSTLLLDSTSFAVLFLAKATAAAVTGK
ncbi:MAG: hypothetical protein JNK15_13605 [Planctomycetes bacterium]|nr:hypothetical protein [Planctomycetota bacterium]